jgi:hypothetical protein
VRGGRHFSPAKPSVEGRLTQLVSHFADYARAFDERPAFTEKQLKSHVQTLHLRAVLLSAECAARDRHFALSLRTTLRLWKIGVRRSILIPPEDFVEACARVAPRLRCLEQEDIADLELNVDVVAAAVWDLIEALGIVENGNPVVAGTKALHHLLPELVVPIDGKYTRAFFDWKNHEFQNHPRECFSFAFTKFASIASLVNPRQYVGSGWRTSGTKIIDNAAVAFCRLDGLESSKRKAMENRSANCDGEIAMREATLLTGGKFNYEGSLQTEVTVFHARSQTRITRAIAQVIRDEITARSPVLMGACRKPRCPGSLGETLYDKHRIAPQVLSYAIPLLIEEGFCSASPRKPFVIHKR